MRAFRSVRALLTLGLRLDRRRFIKVVLLMAARAAAAPLIAVGLAWFVDAALGGDTGRAVWVGVVLAALVVIDLTFEHFAHLSYSELGELAHRTLHEELFALANDTASLERREQSDYADKLQLAREGLGSTLFAFKSVLQFCGLLVQLVITTYLLAAQDPVLILLPLLAFGLVVTSQSAHRVRQRAEERGAKFTRQSNHLLELATFSSSTLLELQMLGLEDAIIARQRLAWDRATASRWRGQLTAALIQCGGQLVFIAAYAGAVLLVLWEVAAGRATVGVFVLVLALTVQMSGQVIAFVDLLTQLQRFGVTLERVDWLRGLGAVGSPAGRRVAIAGRRGIRLEGVAFQYPGRETPAVQDITVDIPAGSVVALVGENGAGKSTLVKLLCGMYTPTAGRIIYSDGTEVTPSSGNEGIRDRVSCMFQDFARLQLSVLDSVGVGEVRDQGPQQVCAALSAAGADEFVASLPNGLATNLGTRYIPGYEPSGGQWQKIALARALMRPDAELVALDEPAAALDAAGEHALFERFTETAQQTTDRAGITLFVSHRFSTVRMADYILVLEGGRITRAGRHEELMHTSSVYADLYQLQARAYT
ncbi:ABC transporter ATP-binding protein [Nocardia sp. NPDC050435]|uniref:ABC transporter ATP-binding protein n=1 Tax=Nocardia sp. NPDC050435 TaxID=3155040 RepID=UPI0033EA4FEA